MEIIASIETPLRDEQTELTTTHVCQTQRWWGGEQYTSIPLRQLSSIAFRYDAPVGWVVFGVLSLLASFVLGMLASGSVRGTATILGFAATGAFIMFPVSLVIYFLGRRQALVLASSSTTIIVTAPAAGKELLRNFATEVEGQQAKILKVSLHPTKPVIPIKPLRENSRQSMHETEVQFNQK